jgi:hypothetical protein
MVKLKVFLHGIIRDVPCRFCAVNVNQPETNPKTFYLEGPEGSPPLI